MENRKFKTNTGKNQNIRKHRKLLEKWKTFEKNPTSEKSLKNRVRFRINSHFLVMRYQVWFFTYSWHFI